MPWKFEWLHDLGSVNGTNKVYPLSEVPVASSLIVAFPFTLLEPVGSQPQEMQYTLGGGDLTLGLAPASGTKPWVRYFYE